MNAHASLRERPPISRPDAPRERDVAQPRLGLWGLTFVVPIAAVLAAGAGGDASVQVLGPIVAYALPLVAMVAFWWEDWPGSRLRWSGWVNTALIAAGAVVLTAVGQVVAGGLDLGALFDPTPGTGHVPTFPSTMALAGAAFVAMLELTLVGEGWPLRRLPPVAAGLAALAISWAIALAAVLTLVEIEAPAGSHVTARNGPVAGADFGAALIAIGAYQVLFYVVWRGWPFSSIAARSTRLTTAHAAVLGAGAATYVVAHDGFGVASGRLAALAGCFIAAGLLSGMLFEGWPEHCGRGALLLANAAIAVVLFVALGAVAGRLSLTRANKDDWVSYATLSALGVSIILHVAIGRRWPFAPPSRQPS